jgi:signal transduction histidine kinase
LQTGALIAVCKDDELKQRLDTLKETLSEGMDSIRDSIHDLHDESVDLFSEANTLVKGFSFCGISLDYDVESNPERNVKYALLAVMKEALSNIIRHSDATQADITLREHPAFYQLVVHDNGHKKPPKGDGIGLKNIVHRVEALDGRVNISSDNGFTVFVTIPKESIA